MAPIATYVFLDLETTGLPEEECYKTKIIELSLVAVKRRHILRTRPGCSPRVQNKVTLCLNPGKLINPDSTDITGLCNDLLEFESYFDINVFNILNTFLNVLEKPVCLIAQNGHHFDFPILKSHLVKLNVSFNEDLMCADSFHGFYDVMKNKGILSPTPAENATDTISVNQATCIQGEQDDDVKKHQQMTSYTNCSQNETVNEDETDLVIKPSIQNINETTPKKKSTATEVERPRKKCITPTEYTKVCRRWPWTKGQRPKESYKLKDIYERLLNKPAQDAHRAENDCILALECCVAIDTQFVEWVDENHCKFADVIPMQFGFRRKLF